MIDGCLCVGMLLRNVIYNNMSLSNISRPMCRKVLLMWHRNIDKTVPRYKCEYSQKDKLLVNTFVSMIILQVQYSTVQEWLKII